MALASSLFFLWWTALRWGTLINGSPLISRISQLNHATHMSNLVYSVCASVGTCYRNLFKKWQKRISENENLFWPQNRRPGCIRKWRSYSAFCAEWINLKSIMISSSSFSSCEWEWACCCLRTRPQSSQFVGQSRQVNHVSTTDRDALDPSDDLDHHHHLHSSLWSSITRNFSQFSTGNFHLKILIIFFFFMKSFGQEARQTWFSLNE